MLTPEDSITRGKRSGNSQNNWDIFLNSNDTVLKRASSSQKVVNFKMEWNWNWSQFMLQKSKWWGTWRLLWCNRREDDVARNGAGLTESLALILALPIATCVTCAITLWKLIIHKKNWCFWTVVLEKTLESPLDCKEIQPVHPRGDQPCDFFGRNDAKAETPALWPPHVKSWLIGKDSDAGRDWGQEEKGTTEDEMAGWHHWLDGHESQWTPGVGDGQGGLACCDSWGRKESDTTEWLIWSDLICGCVGHRQEQGPSLPYGSQRGPLSLSPLPGSRGVA